MSGDRILRVALRNLRTLRMMSQDDFTLQVLSLSDHAAAVTSATSACGMLGMLSQCPGFCISNIFSIWTEQRADIWSELLYGMITIQGFEVVLMPPILILDWLISTGIGPQSRVSACYSWALRSRAPETSLHYGC